MYVRRVVPALLAVCLFSAAALAQEAAIRVSPTTIRPGDEAFLTIYASGISENDVTQVTFSGPGGTISAEPTAWSSESITVAVPNELVYVEGTYQVDVYVTRPEGVVHYGPGYFEVDVPDDGSPFGLFLPEVVVGDASSREGGVVTFFVASSDGTPVDCTPPSGALFPFGPSIVTCTATNGFNETATGSFLVFVLDGSAPVVTVPDDIITDNPVVTFEVSATDNIDPDPELSCSPASGSTFPYGTTRVRCTAVDLHANFGFAEFNVTVTGGPPILTVSNDITADATSAAGAVVEYTVEASNADVLSCAPLSGSLFALGTTTVNCSATNAVGTTDGSFKVTVRDFSAPTLNVHDMTVNATSDDGAIVTFPSTASDLVDGDVPMTCNPPSGSLFPFGTTFVDCSATDGHGNVGFAYFTVSVVDGVPPVVDSISVSPNALWPPDHKMYTVNVSVSAYDNTDPAPISKIVSITSNQPVNGTGDGDQSPDWKITAALKAQLRAERSGNQDRIYTITVETSDMDGNITTSTVEVKVTQTKGK